MRDSVPLLLSYPDWMVEQVLLAQPDRNCSAKMPAPDMAPKSARTVAMTQHDRMKVRLPRRLFDEELGVDITFVPSGDLPPRSSAGSF